MPFMEAMQNISDTSKSFPFFRLKKFLIPLVHSDVFVLLFIFFISRLWQQLSNKKVLAGPVSDVRHKSTSRLKQLATHLAHFPPGQYCVV